MAITRHSSVYTNEFKKLIRQASLDLDIFRCNNYPRRVTIFFSLFRIRPMCLVIVVMAVLFVRHSAAADGES